MNATSKKQIALGAFVKLMRAAESVSERTLRHLADTGITPSQFAVLEALLHLGPQTQKVLARKILRSGGNMTMVIDNLEKAGLVRRERSTEDGRAFIVSLTARGDALIRKVFPRHAESVLHEMSVLSEKELQQLGDLCRKVGLGRPT
jgi:MarR family 2-MHQ and catechol resistance regulon transcriptional repressor